MDFKVAVKITLIETWWNSNDSKEYLKKNTKNIYIKTQLTKQVTSYVRLS